MLGCGEMSGKVCWDVGDDMGKVRVPLPTH